MGYWNRSADGMGCQIIYLAWYVGFAFQYNGTVENINEPRMAGTLSSKVMVGMLIVQDLAVVPFMVLLPMLNDPSVGWLSLEIAILKAVLFLAGMIFFGTRLLPRIMQHVAHLGHVNYSCLQSLQLVWAWVMLRTWLGLLLPSVHL